ncbi:MAG TPA: hypothetical protein VG674_01835 [Amycolatopsis sp.]|nr:hypothetical protein [Amycolatopsis sp.]
MGANESRGRVAATRLRAVATPELYRRNPFRITGLTATASRRAVREQRLRVLGVLEVGGARPSGVPSDVAPDELRAAFDALGNTEHRFVDELFWTWGPPEGCGCPPQLHDKHDTAVRAHAAAIDAEAELTDDHPAPLWTEAARAWAVTLRSEAFWQHLVQRIAQLGDRRLDESTVEGIRGALPGALLAPLVALTAESTEAHRLVAYLPLFGGDRHTVAEARSEAADGTYLRLESLLKELRRLLDEGRAREAAERAVADARPLITRLEELVPREDFRRTETVSEAAAVVANNIGVALSEAREASIRLAKKVFALARELTEDPETLETITRNEKNLSGIPSPSVSPSRRSPAHPAFSPGTASTAPLWDSVAALIKGGRYDEAGRLLKIIAEGAEDAADREQARTMLDQVRELQGTPSPARRRTAPRFYSAPRVFLALLHVAFGITLLATLLTSPLLPILLLGIPGLFASLGVAGDVLAGPGRLALLLVSDAIAGLTLWLLHANGTAIPAWVTWLTAAVLLLFMAGRTERTTTW